MNKTKAKSLSSLVPSYRGLGMEPRCYADTLLNAVGTLRDTNKFSAAVIEELEFLVATGLPYKTISIILIRMLATKMMNVLCGNADYPWAISIRAAVQEINELNEGYRIRHYFSKDELKRLGGKAFPKAKQLLLSELARTAKQRKQLEKYLEGFSFQKNWDSIKGLKG